MNRLFKDQMQRAVSLLHPPKRIVSLVPSQTELLYDLGLEEEVLGITKFCLRPSHWFHSKKRVGGTKKLNLDAIDALQPDLIIGNKEENEKQQIEILEKKYSVWMSDVATFQDALRMIILIGELVDKKDAAKRITTEIETRFANLPKASNLKRRAAYIIWRDPYMVAASGTFIDEMLRLSGFENIFHSKSRYPEISPTELAAAAPEVILLSSEPYPFQEKHKAEFKQLCPAAVIQCVDGELFSWYGSRLIHSAAYFEQLQKDVHTAAI